MRKAEKIQLLKGLVTGDITTDQVSDELQNELMALQEKTAVLRLIQFDTTGRMEILLDKKPLILQQWKKVYSSFCEEFASNRLTEEVMKQVKAQPELFFLQLKPEYNAELSLVARSFIQSVLMGPGNSPII